jgi:hypothetical protein
MWRSRYLSATSGLVAVGLALGSACCGGNGNCGPGSAAPDGLELAGTGIDVHYSGLKSTSAHDCPDPNAPAGATSVTISGAQTTSSFPVDFCVPRNDLLGVQGLALGTDVKIIDLTADIGNGCTLALGTTPAPTGTITATGVCGDGADHAGFAMTFENGTVPIVRTCGSQVDELTLALTGTVAVSGP